MRMVKADNVQSSFTSIFLAAHQLLRSNQKAISFCFLFARIGNRISLDHNFIAGFKSSKQEAAALERIVTFAVLADLIEMWRRQRDHNPAVAIAPGSDAAKACSISAMMSLTF